MKTNIILFFCLCLLNLATAQSDSTLIQNPVPPTPENNQTFNLGLQISPVTSWMTTDDNTIKGDGISTGLRVGLIGEKYFQENYAIMGSFSLLTNQGGTLIHDTGGNLWPSSNLSDPNLNKGQKPLPDGTKLGYSLNYLEFAMGLKLKTNSIGNQRSLRIYAELPTFAVAYALKAKGEINATGINTNDEEIKKEVRNLMLAWGLGGGIELTLKNGIKLIGGVSFQQSMTDITKNKGKKAFDLIDDMGTTDPTDDEYELQDENSKALLHSLTYRIGIFF
jgi:outer membrane protein with beta-barrel domain